MEVAAILGNHFRCLCHISIPHPNKTCSITTTLSRRLWSCYSTVNSRLLSPPFSANQKGIGMEAVGTDKLEVLKQKLELAGISYADSCVPGQYSHLLCPKCEGGKSMERSLSLHIIHSVDFAMWRCYRTACGWAGQAFADSRMTIEGMNITLKVNSSWDREVKAEGIALEPLSEKRIAYFGERMIREETLKRNGVQQIFGDQDIIAFTYGQNNVRVGCKYRTIEKRFWQRRRAQKNGCMGLMTSMEPLKSLL